VAKHDRVGIGFAGGQVLEARITDDVLTALRKALGGEGWHELETEDGVVSLDLAQVVYVRAGTPEHRVGFGL